MCFEALAEGAEIIVCTPGRLDDFLERGVVSMSKAGFTVFLIGFYSHVRCAIASWMRPTGCWIWASNPRSERSSKVSWLSLSFWKESFERPRHARIWG